jgi:hypothetical protein
MEVLSTNPAGINVTDHPSTVLYKMELEDVSRDVSEVITFTGVGMRRVGNWFLPKLRLDLSSRSSGGFLTLDAAALNDSLALSPIAHVMCPAPQGCTTYQDIQLTAGPEPPLFADSDEGQLFGNINVTFKVPRHLPAGRWYVYDIVRRWCKCSCHVHLRSLHYVHARQSHDQHTTSHTLQCMICCSVTPRKASR